MSAPPTNERRPRRLHDEGDKEIQAGGRVSAVDSTPIGLSVADLDAWCLDLAGRIVVQVVVDSERDLRRTYLYRSTGAAQNCVARARERGQVAHVSLVKLVPVGVITGMEVGR
ncbi:hypothetical protein KLP28_01770 [Nocardioidaceae bacterium]|nr:hypothetical protein KLP28_01770 [Nocardioidaceae bacterium]